MKKTLILLLTLLMIAGLFGVLGAPALAAEAAVEEVAEEAAAAASGDSFGPLNIIQLLCGLALFLYGITLMGDGLNLVAGNKLEVVLYRLTSNRAKGILLGTLVTAVIQSSSAASVMCVGFVNSGLMKFKQAVSIILGSILGSSITSWIICLSSVDGGGSNPWLKLLSTAAITGIIAIVGIYLRKFSKKPTHHHIGDILMGFAILMTGMSAMSGAMEPLQHSETFKNMLHTLSNPALGILVGAVFTAIIQSSAAAVGILQALALQGTMTFDVAFPMVLGIAVGGALPVLLSALGANKNGVRTAVAHLVIDVLGAVICGVLFYGLNAFLHFSFAEAPVTIVHVALINTGFRVVTVFALAPFIGLLEKVAFLFVPQTREAVEEVSHNDYGPVLEERFIRYPAVAFEQSRLAVNSMAAYSQESFLDALQLLTDYSEEGYARVSELETLVDRYEDALGSYLLRITATELTKEQNEDLYAFLHAVTDFERISDHALNIADSAKELHEKEIEFSEPTYRELDVLQGAVNEVLELAVQAFVNHDADMALKVEPLEELIDGLCAEMKSHHVERLQKGICTLQHGFVFNDLLTNYERIGDHCSNIAVAMIELAHDVLDAHEYLDSMKNIKNEAFNASYEEYKTRYSLD